MLQEQPTGNNSRHAAEKHVTKSPPNDIPTQDLRWHEDRFDGSGEYQPDSNCSRCGYAKKQDQDGHGEDTRADPGKRDEQSNDEPDGVLQNASPVSLAYNTSSV
jgi:hypothetical protein